MLRNRFRTGVTTLVLCQGHAECFEPPTMSPPLQSVACLTPLAVLCEEHGELGQVVQDLQLVWDTGLDIWIERSR